MAKASVEKAVGGDSSNSSAKERSSVNLSAGGVFLSLLSRRDRFLSRALSITASGRWLMMSAVSPDVKRRMQDCATSQASSVEASGGSRPPDPSLRSSKSPEIAVLEDRWARRQHENDDVKGGGVARWEKDSEGACATHL